MTLYTDWDVNIAGQVGQPGGATGPPGSPGSGYLATSPTTQTISIGSKTIATQAGLAYTVGARVRLASHGTPAQWMEGLCTAYDPVGGAMTIQIDLTSAMVNSAALAGIPNCGRLRCSGNGNAVTSLTYLPYMGDLIKIAGVLYQIPSTGIVGLNNTSVYVNGVAGQNLVSNTLYYVYAFVNAGVLTADFSTTTHATSSTAGNVGIEIKSGDDTRSLLGMALTAGASPATFYDIPQFRYTRSWFNRPRMDVRTNSATGGAFSGNSTYVNTTSAQFVCFANEPAQLGVTGFLLGTIGTTVYHNVWLDGAAGDGTQVTLQQSGYYINVGFTNPLTTLAEGSHSIGFAVNCATNTVQVWGMAHGMIG